MDITTLAAANAYTDKKVGAGSGGGGGLPALDVVFPSLGQGTITDEATVASLADFLSQGVKVFQMNFTCTDENFPVGGTTVMNFLNMQGSETYTGLFVVEGPLYIMFIPSSDGWGYALTYGA